jgi:hypothetical protein
MQLNKYYLISEAIEDHWGERCPDVQPGCPCCDAWIQFDELVEKVEKKNNED